MYMLKRCMAYAAAITMVMAPMGLARSDTGDDQSITKRVEAALRTAPELVGAPNISAETSNGEVTLSGSTPTHAEAQKAIEVARGIEGVKKVEDKMVRESETGAIASPHQSQAIGAPLKENHTKDNPTP